VISLINILRLALVAIALLPLLVLCKKKFLYHFFNLAGPSFIKLGQMLATRPDLVGDEISLILSKFQDRVKPFSTKKVRSIIHGNLVVIFQKNLMISTLLPLLRLQLLKFTRLR